MGRYIIRRLIYAIPVLIIASIISFTVVSITTPPRPPRSPNVTEESFAEYEQHLGLDKPGWQQYTIWLGNFVTLDWGDSIASGQDVMSEIGTALWNSLILGIATTIVSLSIGISLGVYSALRQYSFLDHATSTFAFVGVSMPTFWLALMLQLFFGYYLTQEWLQLSEPIFYTAGMSQPGTSGFNPLDLARHMALPIIVVSVQVIAVYSRYVRASMLEILQSDFLRTARAKGIRERRVVVRHAMRNALIPITTQVAIDIGAIASGLIITEAIFQWPGMGPLFLDAVSTGDYPVILAYVMITVIFVIIFNLIADILYAFLDPRIRYA